MSKIALSGNASGTGTFTIASPNSNSNYQLDLPAESGTVITTASTTGISASALSTGTIPKARMYAGAVLQVVQTTKTDTFSLSGTTSFTDITGLSVSITPSSSSNKILIFYTVQVGTDGYCDIRLLRNSTAIALGDAASGQTQSTTHSGPESLTSQLHHSMVWLDSPATTSATTYKLQLGTPYNSAYNAYINRAANNDAALYNGRTVSSITVMEIAA